MSKVLERKWLTENDNKVNDVTSVKYKLEEYYALNGIAPNPPEDILGDFSREEMNVAEYHIPHIKSIVLVDKVRVVNALVGFSRLTPVSSTEDCGYVDIKEKKLDGILHMKLKVKGFL